MAEADTEEPRTKIDWPAAIAGAGAAVTVAVLLSTLGAAGTLIGAALGSVIATVSSALYKQGIESSRRRVSDLQEVVLQRVSLAEQSLNRAAERSDGEATDREVARAQRHLDAVSDDLAEGLAEGRADDGADEPGEDRRTATDQGEATPLRWSTLPWKRIALLTAAVFLLALLVISAIELIAGKSVSTITGGTDGDDRTSIGGVFDDGSSTGDDRREPTPVENTPTPTPTPTPTESPSSQAPVQSDSPTPSETATPSPTETVTVTETATPTPTPTPAPTVAPTP
ncbi:hypothetical protein FHP29_20840 [Nocardioides albidus]|uniref:Uncharacterized protein n=1 Tax=Nocardioides albidus TaxID=1517589 RepID=A0A5C4VMA8_9ACTN|nr:hypothetical protein [Nocardioides albidus]TNM36576.1 hypothetical protein FHP29_20840 [Nocardioides albidus]